jgi:hypothetical protein
MSLHGLQEKVNVNSLEEEMQSGRPLVILRSYGKPHLLMGKSP